MTILLVTILLGVFFYILCVIDTSPAEIYIYEYVKVVNLTSEGKNPMKEYEKLSVQNKLIVFSGYYNEKFSIIDTCVENGIRLYVCKSMSRSGKYVIMLGKGGIMASVINQDYKSGMAFSTDPSPLLFV